jgi:hypothetical protein
MTSKGRVWIFVAAGVCCVAFIGLIAFMVVQTISSVRHPPPTTAAERRLVVTTESLEPFGFHNTGGRGENIRSMHQLDGSSDIQYNYESKNDPKAREYLYVLSKVQIFAQSLAAMQVFKMEQLAIRAGVGLQGKAQLVPRPELVTFGDQQYAVEIRRGDKPAGNLFIIRQGRVVHMLTIGGIHFEDPKQVEKLFKPILEESKRQFP